MLTESLTRSASRDVARYGDPPKLRAARHVIRSRFSEHPAVYLPFARRRYPGPSPKVLDQTTEFVIDGYTRSACTFAVYAFQLSQPRPVRLAHHLHAPAQLIVAATRRIPNLVVIREPAGTVLSQVVREPHVSIAGALVAYARFYSLLLPHARWLVAGEFDEVTNDFASVIARVNDRFGTSYATFEPAGGALALCLELIGHRATSDPGWRNLLLGFESGTVTRADLLGALEGREALAPSERAAWIPSAERTQVKQVLRERLDTRDLAPLRRRAEAAYEAFVDEAGR